MAKDIHDQDCHWYGTDMPAGTVNCIAHDCRARQVTGGLGQQAATWLRSVADMLEKKNQAYGDSAGQPVRVFSKSDTIEQLKVRADDKLSRLTRGTAAGEDAVMDLCGYIALLAAAGWKGNG